MNKLIARHCKYRITAARKHSQILKKETPTAEILASLKKLIDVIKHLRNPYFGCQWDLKQDNHSLVEALVEETFEAVQSIEDKKTEKLSEEFGDLLFLILMHIHIAEQNFIVKFDNVIKGITDKLIRRHPHIFAGLNVSSTDEILMNWETIKKSEKENQSAISVLNDIPRSLPALQRILRLFDKINRLSKTKNNYNLSEVIKILNEKINNLKNNDENKLAKELSEILAIISYIAFMKKIKLEDKLQKYINAILNSINEENNINLKKIFKF
ncbi:MAG TPA: MazG family protein [bacterium]|nr:MazG family protein [bacterium]